MALGVSHRKSGESQEIKALEAGVDEYGSSESFQLYTEASSVMACSRQQIIGCDVSLSIDSVVVEEPLQIILNYLDLDGIPKEREYLVTMRTPGDDRNLVTGLLLAEGVIQYASDIVGMNDHLDLDELAPNEITVRLSPRLRVDWSKISRETSSFSSCGVCGKSSMKSLELRDIPSLDTQSHWLTDQTVLALSNNLRQQQALFETTGGVHGGGLFDEDGQLLAISEDIGRHNALDKLLGARARDNSLTELGKVVMLTSRISFELVQKVLVAGVPVLVAAGAPSNLALNMAKRFNLTLIGFNQQGRFNVYHGAFRLRLHKTNK
ncbi:formate dehydrogenase accessory sulfurtransferase FdhD [Photobacterium sanctipauli]|uniref:Sulfur carrier protein FdhD n=1 Tax=Photobacterium sanctipauli TaxID=1342794 RepID=A0A2T3NZL8_9GAMM|nr:formate dehydrogenase accessory sulfurtransferase FdhD [Photobacterium sanctipauli]PSW21705.1 formate dehydrogenase accessory sulfurtransferase FdhD [Photobacterium sanctipauli]